MEKRGSGIGRNLKMGENIKDSNGSYERCNPQKEKQTSLRPTNCGLPFQIDLGHSAYTLVFN